jgi:hypothetical protein
MYDRDLTESSKGALVELLLSLGGYRQDIVLAGGWAPYFLTRNHFNHCGSVDIDLVLHPSIIAKYESIQNIIKNLGYQQTPNIFRFKRTLTSPKTNREYTIHLDFLTEPHAVTKTMEKERLIEVQKDLKACLIEGSSIVFNFNYKENIEATIPNNGEASTPANVADIVGCLSMKGQALLGRFKDKDYYDIYALTGFHQGNPKTAGKVFAQSIKDKGFNIEHPTIWSSLSTIRNSFSSLSRIGPSMVSRFVGANTRTDAYERVNEFLQVVATEFSVR